MRSVKSERWWTDLKTLSCVGDGQKVISLRYLPNRMCKTYAACWAFRALDVALIIVSLSYLGSVVFARTMFTKRW
jgi:hypothetical protein